MRRSDACDAFEAAGPGLFDGVSVEHATNPAQSSAAAASFKPPPLWANSMNQIMPEWLLVDGSSMFFRAFYAIPQTMRGPNGALVNAVRGTLDTLARYLTTRKPRRVAFTTDEDWRPDWRVELIPGYKEHRVAEPIPPGLIPQVPVILAALEATGVDVVGLAGYEAEDIVASLAAKVKPPIEIASGDRDLFSQVRGRDIIVLYPQKGGPAEVDEAEVARRYKIPGRAYSDFAILRGDPSDGLPGIPGIGDKTAAQLVKRYGSVDKMLEAGVFRDTNAEYLEKALQVVPPVRDLKIKVPKGRRARYPAEPEIVEELAKRYGIGSNLERLTTALNSLPPLTKS
ncbi:MAG TPA: 5'-3' exonuclease H3TH domain-containing protein [Candidatus Dormibacteraeota bacterium]|nr:5'-3' exonuclease H3TH domain-containing protein [Candidatus Dormibacteraeota bacterium]